MSSKPQNRSETVAASDEETSVLIRRITAGLLLLFAIIWLVDYLTHGLIFFYLPFILFAACCVITLSVFIYYDQRVLYPKIIAWRYYLQFYKSLVHLLLLFIFLVSMLQIFTAYGPFLLFFQKHLYWVNVLRAVLFVGNFLLSYLVLALKFVESGGRLVNNAYVNDRSPLLGQKTKKFMERLREIAIRFLGHDRFDWYIGIVLFAIFLVYRTIIIAYFRVNYADEFLHAVAGIELFKTRHFPILYNNISEPYLRGSYVTVMVGFFLTVFGKYALSIKIVPLIIGGINYWLVRAILKKVVKNRFLIYLTLLVFIFNPWTTLNHFNARMYVFYELFILLVVLLLIKINESVNQRKISLLFSYVSLLVVVNYISYYWSFDQGKLAIVVASGVGIVLLVLFELMKNSSTQDVRKVDNVRVIGRGVALVALLSLALLLSHFRYSLMNKVGLLASSEFLGSYYRLPYLQFFYSGQSIMTMLVVVSFSICGFIKSRAKALVIIITGALLAVHLVSGLGAQIIRGILYLLPLYFIVSAIAYDYLYDVLRLNSRPIARFSAHAVLLLALAATLIAGYPSNFTSNGPGVPGDLMGGNYSEVYNTIQNIGGSPLVVQVGYYAPASKYYGIRVDYELITNNFDSVAYAFCQSGNLKKECFLNIPLVETVPELGTVTQGRQVCLLSSNYNEQIYLTESDRIALHREFSQVVLFPSGHRIYCR